MFSLDNRKESDGLKQVKLWQGLMLGGIIGFFPSLEIACVKLFFN